MMLLLLLVVGGLAGPAGRQARQLPGDGEVCEVTGSEERVTQECEEVVDIECKPVQLTK